jgi:Leucine-rich repeat (LRR) protein
MRNSIVIVALALLPMSFAHAQIPTAERDALISFYNSTNGAGWSNNTSWLGAVGTECTWYGVTCVLGHVSRLELPFNRLTGTLPAELGDFPSLLWLHLYTNKLSGSIPPEIGGLTALESIRMGGNQLSGSIPPEIWNLTALRGIELFNNQVTGSLPPEIGDLPYLFRLSLYNNQLTGSIPPELGNISSLRNLNLAANQFSGSIPPELGNVTGLTGLDLGNNDLTGSIPTEFGNLTDLYVLDLAVNQLSGGIPPTFGTFSNLIYLELNGNQLSGSIPPELADLTNLQKLYLSTNRLTGGIPPELGSLSSLERLYLYSNQLSGDIPTELENLTSLFDTNGLRIRWNALHSDNATLITFLDGKQWYGDWQSTQTIAPVNLTIDRIGDHTVWLTWDAVSYQIDRGGYSVCSAPTSSGAWTCDGWTEEKTDTTYPVTGLDPATTYDLAVVSYTDPHVDNQNVVNSDFSSLEMATTDSSGCAQPETEIMWGSPNTHAVSGSYDSYLWITGEATSTIDITPLYDQWYWVTVTSAGPCEETALTWVDPTTVFVNGFESGDTTRWSSTVP